MSYSIGEPTTLWGMNSVPANAATIQVTIHKLVFSPVEIKSQGLNLPAFSVPLAERLCGEPVFIGTPFLLEGHRAEISQRRLKPPVIVISAQSGEWISIAGATPPYALVLAGPLSQGKQPLPFQSAPAIFSSIPLLGFLLQIPRVRRRSACRNVPKEAARTVVAAAA
jgi:hypothetical protein